METSHTVSAHTHNFRLLLRHFLLGRELLAFLVRELRVSQELFNQLRTVQVVLRFPRVFCTVAQGWGCHLNGKRLADMLARRLTHSVKPFHLRKYSALPFTTRRRMILSTANSCTTAVSSVFLCLAVCFFLILPSTTRTRTAVHEHKHSATSPHLKRDTGATITRYVLLLLYFGSGARSDHGTGGGSRTVIRALVPAAPPDVDTLSYCSFNPHDTHANQCAYVRGSEGQHVTRTHEGNMTVGTVCTYAVAVYGASVDGRTAAVQLGCSEPVAGN